MNLSNYNISFNKIENLLKEFGLFRMKGVKKLCDSGVSAEFKNNSIKGSYYDTYTSGLKNFDYDFLLADQSFFQFEFKNSPTSEIRYAFFQNPVDLIPYPEYVSQELEKYSIEFSVEEIGDSLLAEYDQYIAEQEIISNFSTIRYDLDNTNYQPLVHSVSHFHFGFQNHSRIPSCKILSPLSFVVMVIKNVYFESWKTKFQEDKTFVENLIKESRRSNTPLLPTNWTPIEKEELHLF